MVYTQGMSLSARLRLARLDPTYADPSAAIADIVAPYVDGSKPWFEGEPGTPRIGGADLGHAARRFDPRAPLC